MLDIKIKYLLDNLSYIQEKVITKYNKNLDIYGKQEAILGISIAYFAHCLSLPGLGDNLKLELYKKFSALLRSANLVDIIPSITLPSISGNRPFYYGASVPGVSIQILQTFLTEDFGAKETKTYSFTATEEVFILCYPQEYGALTRIVDENDFEVLNGWEVRTGNAILGIESVPYYIYETKYITTLTGFFNTFYF